MAGTTKKRQGGATRKKPATTARSKSASSASRFAGAKTFVTGFVLGACSLAIFNQFELHEQLADAMSSHQVTQVAEEIVDGTSEQAGTVFEFYETLQNSAVEVDVQPEETAEVVKFDYMLQVASFKNHADADRLRAQLTLEGIDVELKRVNSSKNGQWYRLMAGPFETRSKMASVRTRLAAHDLTPLVLKQPKS